MKRSDMTPGMIVSAGKNNLVRVVSTDRWRVLRDGEKGTPITIGIETYWVLGVPDPRGRSVAVQRMIEAGGTAYPLDRSVTLEQPEYLDSPVNMEFRHYVSLSNDRIRNMERRDVQWGKLFALWGDDLNAAGAAFGLKPDQVGQGYGNDYLLSLGKIHYRAMLAQKEALS